MWKIWLIFAGIFLIFEIATTGFLLFWLSIGSLIAMVVSFFTDNLIIQTAAFVISSTLLVIFVRPVMQKFLTKNSISTNANSIIGKKAIVTKKVDVYNEAGQIKVNGEIWTAIGENGATYEKGSEVEVVAIDGVKAIIK